MFDDLGSYEEYLKAYPIHEQLGIDLDSYGDVDRKIVHKPYYSVDPDMKEPYVAELDDLIRLHYLVLSRRVTTILEFGVGKSSVVFDNAISINKTRHEKFVSENLRRSNAFECYSVDNNKEWIDEINRNSTTENVHYVYSPCDISTFNDRICTYYRSLPNICPDLIYLDAPDQFSPEGEVRGISTKHPDRLPMSADILAMEHFLLPGTLIIVDGRTANARFLKANLQRDWRYSYIEEYDQHYFELREVPLGVYNRIQLEYCLGEEWLRDVECG